MSDNHKTSHEQRFYTVAEAAEYLNVSERTISRKIRQGAIDASCIVEDGTRKLIPESALEPLLYPSEDDLSAPSQVVTVSDSDLHQTMYDPKPTQRNTENESLLALLRSQAHIIETLTDELRSHRLERIGLMSRMEDLEQTLSKNTDEMRFLRFRLWVLQQITSLDK